MTKIINVLLFSLLVFASCEEDNEAISLMKQSIEQKDITHISSIYSKLKEKRDKLIKSKSQSEFNCEESVSQCKIKNNYKKCFDSLPSINRMKHAIIDRTNNNATLFNKLQCDTLEDAYKSNRQILQDNIDKTKEIVSSLKKEINDKKGKTQSRIASFIEAAKEQKNKTNLFDQIINNIGNMYSMSFVQLPPLKTNINSTYNEFTQIKEKIQSLQNVNDQVSLLEKTLNLFVRLLTDFQNGQGELMDTYDESVERCKHRMEKEKERDILDMNPTETKAIDDIVEKEKRELNETLSKICKLKEEHYSLCEDIGKHCAKYNEELQAEIDELDDLMLYFE